VMGEKKKAEEATIWTHELDIGEDVICRYNLLIEVPHRQWLNGNPA
ncbi:hypothetical protein CEXT_428561, partial [Caerostris extrusa]